MMTRLALAALAALAFAGAPAQAQQKAAPNDYAAQVRAHLGDQAGKHIAENFEPFADVPDFVSAIRIEGGVIWPAPLRAGATYRVFVVCDNDCSDVDLEVFDADGRFVGRDIQVNDTPYVEVTPRRDGPVFARIWLSACESEPCWVAGRVLRRKS